MTRHRQTLSNLWEKFSLLRDWLQVFFFVGERGEDTVVQGFLAVSQTYRVYVANSISLLTQLTLKKKRIETAKQFVIKLKREIRRTDEINNAECVSKTQHYVTLSVVSTFERNPSFSSCLNIFMSIIYFDIKYVKCSKIQLTGSHRQLKTIFSTAVAVNYIHGVCMCVFDHALRHIILVYT